MNNGGDELFYGRQPDLQDALESFRMIRRLGGLKKILNQALSESAKIPEEIIESIDDPFAVRAEAIVLSMTPSERRHPEVIDDARTLRIAVGSGASVKEVRDLVEYHRRLPKPPFPGR